MSASAPPLVPHFALAAAVQIIKDNGSTGLFQYFIKVIPTEYSELSGSVRSTNQYMHSHRFRPFVMPQILGGVMIPSQSTVLPGVFFVYEVAPFMIRISEHRMPLHQLVAKCCAVAGGVFTVLGITDSVIFRLRRMVNKKQQ